MDLLPQAFYTLNKYKQFIVYVTVDGNPKKIKKPANHINGAVWDAHRPEIWTDAETAIAAAKRLGPSYGVGFVFTENDPFFLLDIDSCYDPVNGWSDLAKNLLTRLGGAGVEVSLSGKGLHIIGSCEPFEHDCRNDDLKLELYTKKRFVALTGIHASGDVGQDCTQAIKAIASEFFAPSNPKAVKTDSGWWSDTPLPEWSGPEDDQELLNMALRALSNAAKFGNAKTASFSELWNADERALCQFFPPDNNSNEPYNRSSADAALAQHLAWWTGCNAERMLRMMKESKLYRDKWDREDYLPRTIRAARGNTTGCLQSKINAYQHDNKPEQAAQIKNSDSNFLTPAQQQEHFKGHIYICEDNGIFVPGGYVLDKERYNAMEAGPLYVMDYANTKTTSKAWDAFVMNRAVKFPKVHASTFRPDLKPGTIIEEDSRLLVNTYWPYNCKRTKGDVTPFLIHLHKLFPVERDREIIINYMAALVQYLGHKFKWCPVLQGTQGNGKTLLSRVLSYIIGSRYTQSPRADQISSNFNDWLDGSILVTVEDIFVQEGKEEVMEILKTILDLEEQAIEGKGKKKIMRRIVCNFILNTNHKAGLRKSKDDRRFAVFYTPHQCVEDLKNDDMMDGYFRNLYTWLKNGGYAIIAEWLLTYAIKDEFNPLYVERAPITSTTDQAIEHGRGNVENEVQEAIDSARNGFKGGWVCSAPLDALLKEIKADRRVPYNKRRDLMKSLGYDLHPGLIDGRVTRIMPGESTKPRLYIRIDHKHRDLTDAQAIMNAYKDAQK